MAELYESLQELVAVFVQAEDPTLPFGRCAPQGWPEIRDVPGPAFWLGIPGRERPGVGPRFGPTLCDCCSAATRRGRGEAPTRPR